MKIAVDIMSGESQIEDLITGTIQASLEENINIVMVGNAKVIEPILRKRSDLDSRNIDIEHAPDIIAMDESPMKACRKKVNSSVMKAAQLVACKKADGFFSPGNTGATFIASLLNLKKIPNIRQAGLLSVLPGEKRSSAIIDCGASVDCSPEHLKHFAIIGEIFARYILEVSEPKIGLLNVGEEQHKGNIITLETFKLLQQLDLNFIGNIEGNHIFESIAHVIVCDGFTGNVVLKLSSGTSSFLMKMIKNKLLSKFRYRLVAFMLRKAFLDLKHDLNSENFGGAPILGLKGCAVVGHGKTGIRGICNGIKMTMKMIKVQIHEIIEQEFGNTKKRKSSNFLLS